MRILATGINKCLPLGYPAKGCGRSLKMAKNQRRTRGAGSLYQRKDGVWVATQELPPDPRTGKRRRLTAKGKSRAAAVERLKTKIKNAQLPPLSEWLTHWRETRAYRLRPSTQEIYMCACRRVSRLIGETRLDRLTPQLLTKWQADAERLYSHRTVCMDRTVLTQALEQAVTNGLLDGNPMHGVEAPVGSQGSSELDGGADGRRGLRWFVWTGNSAGSCAC